MVMGKNADSGHLVLFSEFATLQFLVALTVLTVLCIVLLSVVAVIVADNVKRNTITKTRE